MTDIIDKVKEKVKDAKDSVVGTTKDVTEDFKVNRSSSEREDSRYKTASVTEQYNTASSSISEDSVGNTTRETKETPNSSGIVDWDSIIHKGVRTTDMQAVGNVTAVTDTSIVITSAGTRDEFSVPKEKVQAFNGAEVTVDAALDRFEQFRVKVPR